MRRSRLPDDSTSAFHARAPVTRNIGVTDTCITWQDRGDLVVWFTEDLIKVCFYIAHYPVCWTSQIASHLTPWQTCSFWHQLDFSGKHSATVQLLCEDYSLTFPPLSIARYSFIVEQTKITKLRKWQQNLATIRFLNICMYQTNGCRNCTTHIK